MNTPPFKDLVERPPDLVSGHPQIINTTIDQGDSGLMGEISPR